jgi:hypothetical protein
VVVVRLFVRGRRNRRLNQQKFSLSMPGAQLRSLPYRSLAPHLARPRGKIGRVSRLQPLTRPSGPSHWSTREVRGRILSVMTTISFQIHGLEILHVFERVVRAKSARQRASAPKSKNGWEEGEDGAESKKIDI